MLALMNPFSLYQSHVGGYSVDQLTPDSLSTVDALLDARRLTAILLIQADPTAVANHEATVRAFADRRRNGELTTIAGFGLDATGLLADATYWRRVTSLAPHGLRYAVLSVGACDELSESGVRSVLPATVLESGTDDWPHWVEVIEKGPAPVLTAPLRWPARVQPSVTGGLIEAARSEQVTACVSLDPATTDLARQADMIRLIGTDRVIVAPGPGQGIVGLVRELRCRRFTENEIESMISDVPRATLAATGADFLRPPPPRLPTALQRRLAQ